MLHFLFYFSKLFFFLHARSCRVSTPSKNSMSRGRGTAGRRRPHAQPRASNEPPLKRRATEPAPKLHSDHSPFSKKQAAMKRDGQDGDFKAKFNALLARHAPVYGAALTLDTAAFRTTRALMGANPAIAVTCPQQSARDLAEMRRAQSRDPALSSVRLVAGDMSRFLLDHGARLFDAPGGLMIIYDGSSCWTTRGVTSSIGADDDDAAWGSTQANVQTIIRLFAESSARRAMLSVTVATRGGAPKLVGGHRARLMSDFDEHANRHAVDYRPLEQLAYKSGMLFVAFELHRRVALPCVGSAVKVAWPAGDPTFLHFWPAGFVAGRVIEHRGHQARVLYEDGSSDWHAPASMQVQIPTLIPRAATPACPAVAAKRPADPRPAATAPCAVPRPAKKAKLLGQTLGVGCRVSVRWPFGRSGKVFLGTVTERADESYQVTYDDASEAWHTAAQMRIV